MAVIQFEALHPQKLLPPVERGNLRAMYAVRYSWILGLMVAVGIGIAVTQAPQERGTLEGMAAILGIPLLLGAGLACMIATMRSSWFYNLKNK